MPTIALTTSRRGQVLADLRATLQGMRIYDGYHWTVRDASVQTDPRNVVGVPHEERPFFLIEPTPEGARTFEPANQLREAYRVVITAVVDAEGTDPSRKLAAGETMARDLERILTRDIERGGLCVDTRVFTPEILVGLGQDNTVVVVQEVECAIHRTYGEP